MQTRDLSPVIDHHTNYNDQYGVNGMNHNKYAQITYNAFLTRFRDLKPNKGHLNVIERLDDAIYFNIGKEEICQLVSSILDEMMALEVEPILPATRNNNLTTSIGIEEFLQEQIYGICGYASDELCCKYIHVLKQWDSKWKFPKGASMKPTFINHIMYILENIDRNDCSIELLENIITHSNVNLNEIDGLFECFLNTSHRINYRSKPGRFVFQDLCVEDDSVLPLLLKGGLKLPSDALDQYIARRSCEELSPLCFELFIGECVSCASQGLWYVTKYLDCLDFDTFMEWLCKGADASKKFHGTNTFENMEKMNVRFEEVEDAIIIQSAFRGWLARKRFAWNPHTSLGKFYALRDFHKLTK
jgi:hypothetical protein